MVLCTFMVASTSSMVSAGPAQTVSPVLGGPYCSLQWLRQILCVEDGLQATLAVYENLCGAGAAPVQLDRLQAREHIVLLGPHLAFTKFVAGEICCWLLHRSFVVTCNFSKALRRLHL